jgi:hypothetical protein
MTNNKNIMSITVIGNIERQQFGTGTWALVAETGETYELKDCPPELFQVPGKVQIQGQIRDDIMTLAMIGPVLEITNFEILAH